MFDAYISLIIFSLLLLGSPGPAPLAIAATGAIFGVRKGFIFLLGLLLGFLIVLVLQGLVLLLLVGQNQWLMQCLQVLGFLYVLYIAYKIATAPIQQDDEKMGSPPNLLDGVILNVTNPKAYAAMTIVYSQMLLPYSSSELAYITTALVCFGVVIFVDLLWLFLGKLIRPFIQDVNTGRMVRWVFAVLMVIAVFLAMYKNWTQ